MAIDIWPKLKSAIGPISNEEKLKIEAPEEKRLRLKANLTSMKIINTAEAPGPGNESRNWPASPQPQKMAAASDYRHRRKKIERAAIEKWKNRYETSARRARPKLTDVKKAEETSQPEQKARKPRRKKINQRRKYREASGSVIPKSASISVMK